MVVHYQCVLLDVQYVHDYEGVLLFSSINSFIITVCVCTHTMYMYHMTTFFGKGCQLIIIRGARCLEGIIIMVLASLMWFLK